MRAGSCSKGVRASNVLGSEWLKLDADLLSRTVSSLVVRHAARGVTSDVAWGLAFCLEQQLTLSKAAGRVLCELEDDCVAIQAMHMNTVGLLPKGFNPAKISTALKKSDLDGEHWLACYEALRHGFLTVTSTAVSANPLFADLFSKRITFYRTMLPPYASVVHPGGGPEWAVRLWLKDLQGGDASREKAETQFPVLKLVSRDISLLARAPIGQEQLIADLLDVLTPKDFSALLESSETYEV